MVEGGLKENVLPPEASITVNFRLLPGDTPDDVVEHVRRVIDDPTVEIEVTRGVEASPISDVSSDSYQRLAKVLAEQRPELVVAPTLVLGGTDSKHYAPIADNSYRFTPMTLGREDLTRIHGLNERLPAADYERVVEFYRALLRGS